MSEPIAIIGIGCRFPGGVNNPDTFWQLLVNGVDAISEVPPDRFDVEAYYDPTPATPGKVMSRWGGYLDQVDQFDAAFFGISPREADRMDPQQRLLLETAWEALEDAGQVPDSDKTRQTGVFVGLWLNDYEARLFKNPAKVDFYMTTGSGRYSASGRLSYALGLQGPSVTLDTACSSSLVAVHLACQSLRNGECDLALAGGANVILQPHITIAYSQSKMMSPDGRCKFGDARANGYVRSEGAALITLKRLSDAVADGDPIYAVIRGSAINNDGKTSGFLATPGSAGQEEMLRKAYAHAGVSPGAVQYVEAHGTGTNAGDPVEIGALGAVLAEGRPDNQPCLIGSVKTNFGHTEGAAGMAGLIKVALSLKHQTLPASLHFQQPSPNIPWDVLPVKIQSSLTPWPAHEGAAIGGVSAFGIAGTNAHVVLEEYVGDIQPVEKAAQRPILLPLSAQTQDALVALAESYQAVVESADLADIGFTAATRRFQHGVRLAAVASDGAEMAEQLAAFVAGEKRRGLAAGGENGSTPRKVAFIFPGQGGQWVGMGQQLLEQEPAFRAMMEQCQEAMRPYIDWSLIDELQSGARFEEIDVVQPMLFAVEVSLAALWRSWGVEPDGVIGHSMGEVASAYTAGAISLADAAHVICRRSQLMKRVSGLGAMAVVELTFGEALAEISGYEDKLGIAVSNGPRSTVISGDPTALDAVVEKLKAREVFCRPVKVDVAAHSPHMDALRPELVVDLKGLQASEAPVSVYSTVIGAEQSGLGFDAAYWGENLRQPVLFAAAVQKALADGYNTFIEMSPHPVLLAAIEQSIRAFNVDDALTLASTKRKEDERFVMLESLGALYTVGYTVDWARLYPAGEVLHLPTYPWQRERFWVDEKALGGGQGMRREGEHPLLGSYFRSQSGTHFWENVIDLETLPYLNDHQVRDNALLPAAAFADMALAAGQAVFGADGVSVETLEFKEALFLGEGCVLQVILAPEMPGRATFHCFSRPLDDDQSWTLHAVGAVRSGESAMQPVYDTPQEISGRLPESMTGEGHYAAAHGRGLIYGAAFQGVESVQLGSGETLARVNLPEGATPGTYAIHPALLDACFQVLLDTLTDDAETYLPTEINVLRLYGRIDGDLYAYARRDDAEGGTLVGDVLLLNAAGHVLLAAEGLQMQRLDRGDDVLNGLLYETVWESVDIGAPARPEQPGNWLILADNGGFGAELAAGLVDWGENTLIVQLGASYSTFGAGHYQVNPANPEDFQRLLREIDVEGYGQLRGVVHLWGIDEPAEITLNTLRESESTGALSVLHLTQALVKSNLAPRLWLITRNALDEQGAQNLGQAALWGFGGTLANEHPELKPTRLNIDASITPTKLRDTFFSGQVLDVTDLRREQEYFQQKMRQHSRGLHGYGVVQTVNASDQAFTAVVSTPGVLDNLGWQTFEPRMPAEGEVLIEVHATGLNFMNVMSALGIYPGYPDGVGPLGIECTGRIAAVGAGVDGWQVGDEVVSMAYDSLGTHALANAHLVAPKPQNIPFEYAATIPIAYLTAYYALIDLGRMSAGERVLIHAATGGVGLAAVELAQMVGADVFATAGTDDKRAYLTDQLGVQHVMDSRSLAFADEIMRLTNGEGVDLVLNSLAGEAIGRGLSVLRPYGRFLEIGKRDIYQNMQVGLLPFQKSLSYFAIDLDRMGRERPAYLGGMLREIMRLVEAGTLHALPSTPFPAAEVASAFRFMAQAKHIGKIVVMPRSGQAQVTQKTRVRDDGTYLITGGLGGLGLEAARWLAAQGAKQLVLIGRRTPSEEAQSVIAGLKTGGIGVVTAQADVTDPDALHSLMDMLREKLPPLRGVIHAAGVLDDQTIMQMDANRFREAIKPKMDGAWNLHVLTQDMPLDFFVMYSSVAGVLGLAGQSNYAAGNAFLDGLAHYRRARGLPALSVDWGPWSSVGLAAAEANRGERLASRGLGSITPAEGMTILEGLLNGGTAQTAVMRFDATQWAQTYPASANLLAELLVEAGETPTAQADAPSDDFKMLLLAAEAGKVRRNLLETHIREKVAQVLGLAVNRVDVQKPLRNMGIDSLMTLELRNRLESSLKLTLPATLVFNYPTVAALTGHLAEKMGVPLHAPKAEAQPEVASQSSAVDELENLSRDEVSALLAEELDSLDDLLKGI